MKEKVYEISIVLSQWLSYFVYLTQNEYFLILIIFKQSDLLSVLGHIT